MASTSTFLRGLARELRTVPRAWAEDGVKTVRSAVNRRLAADTGGDASLSGAPGKLKVSAKITGATVVTAVITPGPARLASRWAWLESGTAPHTIRPRRKKGLVVAGRVVESADHPGTAGKGTWSKAVASAVKAVVEDGQRRVGRAVR